MQHFVWEKDGYFYPLLTASRTHDCREPIGLSVFFSQSCYLVTVHEWYMLVESMGK